VACLLRCVTVAAFDSLFDSLRISVEVQLLSAAPAGAEREAIQGPDGLPDLMLDSFDRGVVDLRIRGDDGAKGRRARRVPIVIKVGAEIKRYVARFRPEVDDLELLINQNGRPYRNWGVDAMMDRRQESVGFRIHAHGFRHTFATVATQLGWNFKHLRSAMGHEDYMTLHRYVRLAMDRDLGRLED
jgi:integrase